MNNFDPEMINKIQQMIAQNPQLASLLQKPGLLQKLQQIAMNPNDPSVAMQVSSDPDIQQVMSILRGASNDNAFPNPFGGGGGGMGNMGNGMGGGGANGGGLGGFGLSNYGNNMNNNRNNGNNNNQNEQDSQKTTINIQNKQQFDTIIQNTKDKLIACDFYATWCGPCKIISPEFDRLSKFYKNKATFLKIDVDRVKDLSRACGIRAMPTFQFYKNGIKIDEFKGANTRKLNQILEMHTYEPPKPKTFPYTFFPLREDNRPVFAKIPPFAKVFTKIEQKNASIDASSKLKLNDNEMKVLKEICDYLGSQRQWMSQKFTDKHYQVLSRALEWDSINLTLILDILRVLVIHPNAVDYFKNGENFKLIVKMFKIKDLGNCSTKILKQNSILACHIVINMFNKSGLKTMLQTKISYIANGLLPLMKATDVKVRLLFDKVLMCCAFLLYQLQDGLVGAIEAKKDDEQLKKINNAHIIKIVGLKIRCFSMLAEALSCETDLQNILTILMSLGTLLFRDENVIAFAKSIEFSMVLKQCNKRFGVRKGGIDIKQESENESKQNDQAPTKAPDITKCIKEMLKAMDNPKD